MKYVGKIEDPTPKTVTQDGGRQSLHQSHRTQRAEC